ncbi:Domain of uncharacterised function (DUF2825) [Escherichia fergusonii]|nr:Domain of uncharacterised function (DUF2825) [Escherichia fergusonii]
MIILGWYRRYYRIIRVGAGNSALHLKYMYLKPVYPHWRGELLRHRNVNNLANGLSPLAWGTPAAVEIDVMKFRFIPAGAGNSTSRTPCPYPRPVYPRWRGELRAVHGTQKCAVGLSPLARGTRNIQFMPQFFSRFIPAGAGNSYAPQQSRLAHSVYPRWRGELPRQSGL